jgi:hypothetical protein
VPRAVEGVGMPASVTDRTVSLLFVAQRLRWRQTK